MPSTSFQSRISAFEALSSVPSSSSTTVTTSSKSAKYPPLSPHPLDSPISPTASSFYPIASFTPPKSASRSPSPSPPNLGRKTSLIDLKDWVVDDGPCQSVQKSNGTHVNGNRAHNQTLQHRKVNENNAAPNASMPLINLESPPKSKAERPPLPPRKPSYTSIESVSSSRSVSISNENGATLRPPGRSDSLTIEHTYPPSKPNAFGSARLGHAPASSISSFHSVSLSSDGGGITDSASPNMASKNLFVPMDREGNGSVDVDTVSLDESFENVSVTSAISPTNAPLIPFDWEKAMAKPKQEPPKLPQRPNTRSPLLTFTSPPRATPPPIPVSRSTSTSSNTTTTNRRPPPPPPPSAQHHQPPSRFRNPPSRTSLTSTSASASDRSSILSTATTTSRTSASPRSSIGFAGKSASLLRPTPVPAAACSRYEAVFVSSVLNQKKAERAAKKAKPVFLSPPAKKSRQAAGWRGLSVDLITNPENHPILSEKDKADSDDDEPVVGPEDRLNGQIVKLIWGASRLDKEKLRNIWLDCDTARSGSLDRDAFVKGMWRIDEELRRAQLGRRISSSSSSSLYRARQPPKTPKLLLQ